MIHKSRGEVSLVELDTIEYVSVAYVKLIINFGDFFWRGSHLYSMQLFSADTTIFLNFGFAHEKLKEKLPQK